VDRDTPRELEDIVDEIYQRLDIIEKEDDIIRRLIKLLYSRIKEVEDG